MKFKRFFKRNQAKIKRYGTFFILVLFISGLFAGAGSGSSVVINSSVMIKFNDFEFYELPVTVNNLTVIQAVSNYYYVRLSNESIQCVRNSCNEWLAFDEEGLIINPLSELVLNGRTYYLIHNETVNSSKLDGALRDLLRM